MLGNFIELEYIVYDAKNWAVLSDYQFLLVVCKVKQFCGLC